MGWSNIEDGIIRAALETLDEAIAIYDDDGLLVAFNGRYGALHSAFGDEIFIGAHWNDLILSSIRAGVIPEAVGQENAWLEKRRRARGAYSVVRHTPDGKSYQVSERCLPTGGFAVIWTEITGHPRRNQTEGREAFLISSHSLVLEAFQHLIKFLGFEVVGTGQSFTDLCQIAATGLIPKLVISVFDTEQDLLNAVSSITEARALCAETKMIIVTRRLSSSAQRAVADTGVEAILTTAISSTILIHVIDLVLLGQRILPAAMGQPFNGTDRHAAIDQPRISPGLPSDLPYPPTTALTQREHCILQLLANGHSNKAIARTLNLTDTTVKVHIKNLLRKTGTVNRTQAAIWCINHGIGNQRTGPDPSSTIRLDPAVPPSDINLNYG
jgi:two-component system nitrate/nitrite response regulator NarL